MKRYLIFRGNGFDRFKNFRKQRHHSHRGIGHLRFLGFQPGYHEDIIDQIGHIVRFLQNPGNKILFDGLIRHKALIQQLRIASHRCDRGFKLMGGIAEKFLADTFFLFQAIHVLPDFLRHFHGGCGNHVQFLIFIGFKGKAGIVAAHLFHLPGNLI